MLADDEQLRHEARLRASINNELEKRFAPEDEALRNALKRASNGQAPAMQISPLQGKLLQILALACGARRILEIGSMAGYSGIWLARSLPTNSKLISLEINPAYAEMARAAFTEAGISDRAEVRVGPALDLLPALISEAPFDLIFIDADKINNLHYLEQALALTRPGSLIIADNIIRNGLVFQTPPPDPSASGAAAYMQAILRHPRLTSIALSNDDAFNGQDGFTISVVQE